MSDEPVPSAEQYWPEFQNKAPATYSPLQYRDIMEFAEAYASLREKAAVAEERERLEAVIERERTAIAEGVTGLKKAVREREWLGEGRGPYEWDDDRWHDEFNAAAREILAALEPLERIAADMSNSPKTQELVDKARAEGHPFRL